MNKDNFIRVMLREQFGWDIDIKKPDFGTYVIVPRPDSTMATQIAHGLSGQATEWTALTDRLRLLNRWATIRFNHVTFLLANPQASTKYLYFVKNGRDRYAVPLDHETPLDMPACGDEMARLVQSWDTDWHDPDFADYRSREESTWEAIPQAPTMVDFSTDVAFLDEGRLDDTNDQLSGWLPDAQDLALTEMLGETSAVLDDLGGEQLTAAEEAEAAGEPQPEIDEERMAELQAEVAKDLAYEAEHQDDADWDDWDHDDADDRGWDNDADWDRDDDDDWDRDDEWENDDYDAEWSDYDAPAEYEQWEPEDEWEFDDDFDRDED